MITETYNGLYMRQHSIRWDFAIIFQDAAGYGIKIVQGGVVPEFLSKKARFGEIRAKAEVTEPWRLGPYQGTALLSFTGLLSGWSGGTTVGSTVATADFPLSSGLLVCLVSSWSMAPFNSQFTSEEAIKLSGWSSRRWSGGDKVPVDAIRTKLTRAQTWDEK